MKTEYIIGLDVLPRSFAVSHYHGMDGSVRYELHIKGLKWHCHLGDKVVFKDGRVKVVRKDMEDGRWKMELQNQLKGRKNKAAGALFENLLTNVSKFYLNQGFAHIEKTPEPFHITGKEGNTVHGYFEKKAQPDYKGVLFNGRCIVLEAKHTEADRIKQSALTDEQQYELDIYEKFGAYCFILVSLNFKSYYRVPWSVWRDMKEEFGHKYMDYRDLAPYKVSEKYHMPMYLEGIEELAGLEAELKKKVTECQLM